MAWTLPRPSGTTASAPRRAHLARAALIPCAAEEPPMSDAARYRIFGSELSPYSVKVRSYFRYKGIPHEWVVRSAANMDEFRRHAKLPLIPLVLAPGGEAMQDSTPILE